jgi:hypothetical protein
MLWVKVGERMYARVKIFEMPLCLAMHGAGCSSPIRVAQTPIPIPGLTLLGSEQSQRATSGHWGGLGSVNVLSLAFSAIGRCTWLCCSIGRPLLHSPRRLRGGLLIRSLLRKDFGVSRLVACIIRAKLESVKVVGNQRDSILGANTHDGTLLPVRNIL